VLDNRQFTLEVCGVKGSRNSLFRLTLPTDQDLPLLETGKDVNIYWQQALTKALQLCNNVTFKIRCAHSHVVKVSVLLECDSASLGEYFPTCPHCQCIGCEDIMVLRNVSN